MHVNALFSLTGCRYLFIIGAMSKLNLNFPPDLHKRFKAVCALKGVKMTYVLVKLTKKYVEDAEKKLKNRVD